MAMSKTLLRRMALVGGLRTAQRGFSTEKQIAMRITATKNISKITASMKMVSASKLRGDQVRLEAARPYNEWAEAIAGEEATLESILLNNDLDMFGKNNLLVPITSDRGLCGGINSGISRGIRKLHTKLLEQGKDIQLVVIGERGRSQMHRVFSNEVQRTCQDFATPFNFSTASAVATEALKSDVDTVYIVYNKFRSAIQYEPMVKKVASLLSRQATEEGAVAQHTLSAYECEPESQEEVLQDLHEYTLASHIFHSLMEGATSEQSSRMSAMENASKNAGEMINSLQLQYNRARQARITTELIEIISGASALED